MEEVDRSPMAVLASAALKSFEVWDYHPLSIIN